MPTFYGPLSLPLPNVIPSQLNRIGQRRYSGGGGLDDKITAVKCFISGHALSYTVLKATTSECIGPKKKHLNYLVSISNQPNVSTPELVKCLMRRADHHDWSVVFKALITTHYLMSYGNERIIQHLASSTANQSFLEQLASWCNSSDCIPSWEFQWSEPVEMSFFVRRYVRYINARIKTYRLLGIDFCRTKQHNDSSRHENIRASSSSNSTEITPSIQRQSGLKIKTMELDQLMKTLPILQEQFDILLAFDATTSNLNNGIINCAFANLYKDFVKLYINYQLFILRLLELYFTVKQVKRVEELLGAYKKFLVEMNKVSDFMAVIDAVGIDKSDMPNLSSAPNFSLQLLESWLEKLKKQTIGRRQSFSKLDSNDVLPPKIEYATLTGNSSRRRRSFRNSRDVLTPSVIMSPLERRPRNRTRPTTYDNLGEEELVTTTNDNSASKTKDFESLSQRIMKLTNDSPDASSCSFQRDAAPQPSSVASNTSSDSKFSKPANEPPPKQASVATEEFSFGDLMVIDDKEDQHSSPPPIPHHLNTTSNSPFVARTPSEWVKVEL